MGKIVNVSEIERKYILNSFSKETFWDKEFIIYQWYDEKEAEKKTKVIIDLKNFTKRWVIVKKYRISNSECKKTVEYLTEEDINLNTLVGSSFVCKRRSIQGKVSIDSFVRSNGACKYMVENEGEASLLENFVKDYGWTLEDVTDNSSYRNTNMTTPFTEEDKNNLVFLLKVLNK